MRISDWSSDVCSSDLFPRLPWPATSATLAIRRFRHPSTHGAGYGAVGPGEYVMGTHLSAARDCKLATVGRPVTAAQRTLDTARHCTDRKSTRLNSSH